MLPKVLLCPETRNFTLRGGKIQTPVCISLERFPTNTHSAYFLSDFFTTFRKVIISFWRHGYNVCRLHTKPESTLLYHFLCYKQWTSRYVYNFIIKPAGRSLAMKLVETFARPLWELLRKESTFTNITSAMLQVLTGLFLRKTRFHLEPAYSGFIVEKSDNDIVLPRALLFPLSASFHPVLHTNISFIYQRRCIILANDRVFKKDTFLWQLYMRKFK
jgi:hypothetical protein